MCCDQVSGKDQTKGPGQQDPRKCRYMCGSHVLWYVRHQEANALVAPAYGIPLMARYQFEGTTTEYQLLGDCSVKPPHIAVHITVSNQDFARKKS